MDAVIGWPGQLATVGVMMYVTVCAAELLLVSVC